MRRISFLPTVLLFVACASAWAADIPVGDIIYEGPPTLHIGPGAGTPCALGWGVIPTRSAPMGSMFPEPVVALLGKPHLLILGIPTEIHFPREGFPLASVLASLFDFAVASGAIVVTSLVARVGVSIYLLWFPLLLIMMILLTAGLGRFLACASLFSRDVEYLVDLFLTFGILFTAVSHAARMPGKWPPLLATNPPGALSLPWPWCFEQE